MTEDLSSDRYEGRLTGSSGHRFAADFVSKQLKQSGIGTANGHRGYLQPVPLQRFSRDWSAAGVGILQDGEWQSLAPIEDFFIGTSPSVAECKVEAEAVFLGFGVAAPGYGHDPLKNIDLTGKIAVFLSGAPGNIEPELRAHLEARKLDYLTKAGAAGYVRVYSQPGLERFPWERLQAVKDFKGVAWVDEAGRAQSSFGDLPCSATLSPSAARRLFANAPRSYLELFDESAEAGNTFEPFPLNTRVRISAANRFERLESPNILGVIPGSDPAVASEYVVLVAHLDHLGTLNDASAPDRVFNGAIDNAVGVAILLEVGRQLATLPEADRARRPVMLAFVTGEEQGLIGSDYLASHFPAKGKAVAAINLDMPILLNEFTDIVALGSQYSTLGDAALRVAQRQGLNVSSDPEPQLSTFVRSDHYTFVLKGVPALFVLPGPASGGAEARASFMRDRYHQVSDDASAAIRYDQAARLVTYIRELAEEVADEKAVPAWTNNVFAR